jgi:hypothetical protein
LEILSLFKYFLDDQKLKPKFQNYKGIEYNGMNKFYTFISENLLPDQLYAEISKNNNSNIINDSFEIKNEDNIIKNSIEKNNKKELISLTNFINKKVYEKEVQNTWNFLLSWMVFKDCVPRSALSKKKEKEYNRIHNFIIDFCITFVSRSPFNYIDLFILTIRSYFKNESIHNRDILYQNDNLYSWLIETIYYFHNSEIENTIYEKGDLISIKKNSLDLFEDFFIHRRPHKEMTKRIHYILRYSLHLRRIIGDKDDKKIAEITRITRVLLQKIKDISAFDILDMNYKTKFFFYFIIFHKDFNQLAGNKKYISNNKKLRQSLTLNYSKNDNGSYKTHIRIPTKNHEKK